MTKRLRHLNALMLWFLFAGSLRLIRAGLQSLELLHFMLRGCRLSLFTIETCQSEMRLRRQWTFLLDGKKFGPFFLGGGGVAFERSCFSQRIEGLRHVWHQLVGAHEFRPRLVRFALFQQRCPQTISGFGVSGLQLGLRAKLFFRFRPLESARIHFAQFEVNLGQYPAAAASASRYSFSASGICRSTK